MSKDLTLKSQQYLPKNTNVVAKNSYLIDNSRIPLLGAIVATAGSAIPAIITGDTAFYTLLAVTLPTLIGMPFYFADNVHSWTIQRRIFRKCKKLGISLTDKDKDLIIENSNKRDNFTFTFPSKDVKIVVSKDNKKYMNVITFEKSPNSIFIQTFFDAITLTSNSVKTRAAEEMKDHNENPTDLESKVIGKISEINDMLISDSSAAFSWGSNPNTYLDFTQPPAMEAFTEVQKLYLDDLNDRLAKQESSE